MLHDLRDWSLIMAEQDWAEAGVPSSDRTQLTSRVMTPTNVKLNRFRLLFILQWRLSDTVSLKRFVEGSGQIDAPNKIYHKGAEQLGQKNNVDESLCVASWTRATGSSPYLYI